MMRQSIHRQHTISIRLLVLQIQQTFDKTSGDKVLSFRASLVSSNHLSLFDEGAKIKQECVTYIYLS